MVTAGGYGWADVVSAVAGISIDHVHDWRPPPEWSARETSFRVCTSCQATGFAEYVPTRPTVEASPGGDPTGANVTGA